jgi:hypothetical protein
MTCGARGICEDCVTFASQFDTCQLTLAGDLELSGAVAYNTTTHELRAGGETMPVARMMLETKAGDIDAILAHDLRFAAGATLRAIGARPLAIVASGSIVLGALASIDAGVGGAGALPACATPPGPDGDTVDSEPGGGGGAGGGGAGYGASGGRAAMAMPTASSPSAAPPATRARCRPDQLVAAPALVAGLATRWTAATEAGAAERSTSSRPTASISAAARS